MKQRSWTTVRTAPGKAAGACSNLSREGDVEVVDRLVEQQEVGAAGRQQGQHQTGAGLVGGDFGPDGLERFVFGIERLLLLGQEAGADIRAQAHASGKRREPPGDGAQEGRLAGSVGAGRETGRAVCMTRGVGKRGKGR